MILNNNIIMDNLIRNNNVPFQIDTTTGFYRGNIFNNLYVPYQNIQTTIPSFNTQEEELMNEINKYTFYCTELNLYLDLYPTDTTAINYFNQYKTQLDQLTDVYESKYKPLTTDSKYLKTTPWRWLEGPWPWQN